MTDRDRSIAALSPVVTRRQLLGMLGASGVGCCPGPLGVC